MATEEGKIESRNKAEAPSNTILDLGKLRLEEPEEGVFEAYGNVVNLDWTLTDVRIRIAQLMQTPDEDRPTWENQHGIMLERVAITLPWTQAKVLRNLLDGLIKNYEAINGELVPVKLPARPE